MPGLDAIAFPDLRSPQLDKILTRPVIAQEIPGFLL